MSHTVLKSFVVFIHWLIEFFAKMGNSSNSVRLIGFLLLCVVLVSSVYAGNDYLWGEVGDNDYKLAKDTVSKAFFVGLVQSKKYVFKQSVCRAGTFLTSSPSL